MKISKFKEFFLKRKLSSYNIKNYQINDDGSVDVDGDVRIIGTNLDKLPIKFGRVTGYFLCFNLGLKTLEGSPYYVGDSFDCSSNKLVNLKYSPVEVAKHFDCSNNNLTSLEGLSSEIGGNLYCPFNNLKELDSVSNIEGEINCDNDVDISTFSGYCRKIYNHYSVNKVNPTGINESSSKYLRFRSIENKLNEYGIENYTINPDRTVDVDGDVYIVGTSLEKLPIKFRNVTGSFNCFTNNLKTLEGSPKYVGGSFNCSNNELKNLIGSPEEVVDNFDCSHNNLESLEGITLEIGKDLSCSRNKNLKELDSVSNIEGTIYCDDHLDVSVFGGYCKGIRKIFKHDKPLDFPTHELFYYDGGPRYGSATDPSIPKYYDLAKERYFYSTVDKRYYDDYEIQEFERLYYNKFQKKVKIRNEGDLDSIIKKLNT